MSISYFPISSTLRKAHSRKSFSLLTLLLVFLNYSAFSQQGLKAEYYDGTNFDRLASVKFVEKIDQNWNRTPPVPGIDPHRCSIRWTGKLRPHQSGKYEFSARVDDGIRVWIDNKLIIDQWELNDVGIFKGIADLEAYQEYDLKVEYFNALIEGEVRLLWRIPKTEKTWLERVFGESKKHIVIAPEYFLRPDEIYEVPVDAIVSTDENVIESTTVNPPINAKPKVRKKKKENKVDNIQAEAPPKIVVTKKEAEKYIPKNIEFERAKTVMLENSQRELNTFAQFMLDYPQLNVMIEGHTDPVGDAKSNLLLSKRRAYTIARYLIDKGIDKDRIKAEGYGGSRPLVVPEKGKYYPANRRVVFILDGF